MLTYLSGTGFEDVLSAPIAFEIPEETRFAHTWMVAGSGAGKTTALTSMLLADIEKVMAGKCSVILLDSQNQLIPALSRLKQFAPQEVAATGVKVGDKVFVRIGQVDQFKDPVVITKIQDGYAFVEGFSSGIELEGVRLAESAKTYESRLILLDAKDVEFPLSINPFDIDLSHTKTLPLINQRAMFNEAVTMVTFLLGSLVEQAMTPRQETLFKYIAHLLIVAVPEPTIVDVRRIMDKNHWERDYKKYLHKLPELIRDFFETDFEKSGELSQTKQQVMARLRSVLLNEDIMGMFSQKKNKFSLYDEIGKGRCIAINTSRFSLGETGTKMLGRFFLAQIQLAAHRRADLPNDQKMPTFVYVDECHDYLAGGDPNVANILEQARKQKVGLTLIHQFIGQLESEKLVQALEANTSTKYARSLTDGDAKAFAQVMKCRAADLQSLPVGTFMTSVRAPLNTTLPIAFPFAEMDKQPQMTDAEFETLRASMRRRYAEPLKGEEPPVSPSPSKPPDTSPKEDGDDHTKPFKIE